MIKFMFLLITFEVNFYSSNANISKCRVKYNEIWMTYDSKNFYINSVMLILEIAYTVSFRKPIVSNEAYYLFLLGFLFPIFSKKIRKIIIFAKINTFSFLYVLI